MKRTGAYILLCRLAADEHVEVGRLGRQLFERGEYAYVGSAMSGLDARIERHLRSEKRNHWHIDYLLERATVVRVLEFESSRRLECELNDRLRDTGATMPVRGFGSSDCHCDSHLHYLGRDPGAVRDTLRSLPDAASSGWRPRQAGRRL